MQLPWSGRTAVQVDLLLCAGQRCIPQGEAGFVLNADAVFTFGQRPVLVHPDMGIGNRRGSDIDVTDKGFVSDIKPDIPVQTAIGQIINHETKRRDAAVFMGVDLDDNRVEHPELHRQGDLNPECRISAEMRTHLFAVDIDFGLVGRPVQLQEQPPAAVLLRDLNLFPVAGGFFVILRISVVERRFIEGVRQPYNLLVRPALQEFLTPYRGIFPVIVQSFHLMHIPFMIMSIISFKACS